MTDTKEETKRSGFEGCCSMMNSFLKSGFDAKQGGKFNFSVCEQMMKQFCSGKDGKVDFNDICSKMEQFCKRENKGPGDRANA